MVHNRTQIVNDSRAKCGCGQSAEVRRSLVDAHFGRNKRYDELCLQLYIFTLSDTKRKLSSSLPCTAAKPSMETSDATCSQKQVVLTSLVLSKEICRMFDSFMPSLLDQDDINLIRQQSNTNLETPNSLYTNFWLDLRLVQFELHS